MANEKTALINQMEKQRFLPVTQETLHLDKSYSALIDPHDPDELSHLLFYEGEYFFRLGNLSQALDLLTRCLQSPKDDSLLYFNARSYNLIGLIYNYLGQESIAIRYYLLGRDLSLTLSLAREVAICCVNLGNLYSNLGLDAIASDYFQQAEDAAESNSCDDRTTLKVLCLTSRGLFCCKTNRYHEAARIYDAIRDLQSFQPDRFYNIAVLNLAIRLSDFLSDNALLQDSLHQLTTLLDSPSDFLEHSEYCFDICAFLIEHARKAEAHTLLACMAPFAEHASQAFLRDRYFKCMLSYTHAFCSEDIYFNTCSRFISLQPDYRLEQYRAALYSLEYIEQLHQAKNASDLYREKSRIDQMTGLLNKYTIRFLIEEDLANAPADKQSAMILIDLDHFKQINDTLGHLVGDSFICQTSSIIQNYFKAHALCGRIGGDEFLVYISNITDPSSILLQTGILKQELCRRTSERNLTITTQASIGIAFSSESCRDYESLFAAADDALYRAKTEGRNRIVVAD